MEFRWSHVGPNAMVSALFVRPYYPRVIEEWFGSDFGPK